MCIRVFMLSLLVFRDDLLSHYVIVYHKNVFLSIVVHKISLKGLIILTDTKSKNNSIVMLIIAIAIPLAVGGLSTILSGGTQANFEKPPLSPPDWLFPIVWTILYVMIGVASYLIYKKSEYKFNDALKSYCYQLFVNFCWPIVFFRFEYYTAAAVVLGVLILLVISNLIEFYKLNKTAGLLLVPDLVWCLFARYLNVGVAVLNK